MHTHAHTHTHTHTHTYTHTYTHTHTESKLVHIHSTYVLLPVANQDDRGRSLLEQCRHDLLNVSGNDICKKGIWNGRGKYSQVCKKGIWNGRGKYSQVLYTKHLYVS